MKPAFETFKEDISPGAGALHSPFLHDVEKKIGGEQERGRAGGYLLWSCPSEVLGVKPCSTGGLGRPACFAGNGIEEDFPESLSQDLSLLIVTGPKFPLPETT